MCNCKRMITMRSSIFYEPSAGKIPTSFGCGFQTGINFIFIGFLEFLSQFVVLSAEPDIRLIKIVHVKFGGRGKRRQNYIPIRFGSGARRGSVITSHVIGFSIFFENYHPVCHPKFEFGG